MGKLTAFFVGVCVHLPRRQSQETEHRVVVVNASRGDRIHDMDITEHHATLKAGGRTLPLDGVLLTIPNALTKDVRYAGDSFDTCIPHLRDFTTSRSLPALSAEMVRGKNKDLASAYFDAAGEIWAGVTRSGASVAVLEVETEGEPVLRITPFDAARPEEIITLTGIPSVEIDNVGVDDADYDFLLNFRIAERIPEDATWPAQPMRCNHNSEKLPITNVGAGCSNSTYP